MRQKIASWKTSFSEFFALLKRYIEFFWCFLSSTLTVKVSCCIEMKIPKCHQFCWNRSIHSEPVNLRKKTKIWCIGRHLYCKNEALSQTRSLKFLGRLVRSSRTSGRAEITEKETDQEINQRSWIRGKNSSEFKMGWGCRDIQKLSAMISAVSALIERCTIPKNLSTVLIQFSSAL